MRIEADPDRPAGSRVTAIHIGGVPLHDKSTYTVAANDFLSRGGDGYSMFADATRLISDADGPLLANEVMVHIRRLGTVKAGIDGRIALK